MSRYDSSFTGWENRPHIITMPPARTSFRDRERRIRSQLLGSLAVVEYRFKIAEADASRAFQAYVVRIPPGSALSYDLFLEIAARMGDQRLGTLAHLMELAATHREVFRGFERMYAVGSTVPLPCADPDLMVTPYFSMEVEPGSASGSYLVMGDRTMRRTERAFDPSKEDAAFLVVEPLNERLADLCCHGCGP